MDWGEKFKAGTEVISAESRPFGPLNTAGFAGCVRKTDSKAGVCVSLYISRIYKPCFWYSWSALKLQLDAAFLVGAGDGPSWAAALEDALGGRKPDLPDTPISKGCLQSWMLARARAAAGSALETLVLRMQFIQLLVIYANQADTEWNKWTALYDTRPRRPLVSDVRRDTQFSTTIRVSRNKLGR